MQSYDSGMLAFQDAPHLLPSDTLLLCTKGSWQSPKMLSRRTGRDVRGVCRPVEEVS